MSLDGIIARARARWATVMTDTVTVTTKTAGPGVFDPITQTYTPSARTTTYTGICSIRPSGNPTREEDGTVVAYPYVIHFPADTPVKRGDAVTVVTAAHDTGLPGTTLWVADVTSDGWQVTQDAMCTDQVQEVPS